MKIYFSIFYLYEKITGDEISVMVAAIQLHWPDSITTYPNYGQVRQNLKFNDGGRNLVAMVKFQSKSPESYTVQPNSNNIG